MAWTDLDSEIESMFDELSSGARLDLNEIRSEDDSARRTISGYSIHNDMASAANGEWQTWWVPKVKVNHCELPGRPKLYEDDGRWGCRICGGPCVIVGTEWKHRRCLRCRPFRRVYDGQAWPCGHPRTPENTQESGKGGYANRCKQCNRIKAREGMRKLKVARRQLSLR